MKEISTPSLATRTYQHMLESLQSGRWSDGLPAERKLSESLGVSRPVLREALNELEQKGYIVREGRRRVPVVEKSTEPQKRKVLVVHSSQESSMPGSTATMLHLMQEELTRKGIQQRSAVCMELRTTEVGKELKDLQNEYPNDIWVLRSPSKEALAWCDKHHPRCVVLGSQPESPDFSGVDLDIHSMFSHSMSLCLEQHRKNVLFIVPPGKSHARTRLDNFLQQQSYPKMQVHVEELSNKNSAEVKRKILHLLSARPRPDAFICTNFQQWLLVYTLLVEAGISPVNDILLLCHYSDRLMQCISHGVGYYSFDWNQAASFLAEKIESLDGGVAPEVLMLPPIFRPPET